MLGRDGHPTALGKHPPNTADRQDLHLSLSSTPPTKATSGSCTGS
jgi:hypothetical protein